MGQDVGACWICGALGDSAEHRLKRSDARATFGPVSQAQPLYIHTRSAKNVRLNSVNAAVLKFSERLCEDCNTRRTQPFDRAWERLSRVIREQEPSILDAGGFDPRRVFGETAEVDMLHMHLFFVKLTLGQIVSSGSNIDRQPFRDALMNVGALNSLFLKFCIYQEYDQTPMAGQFDVQEWRDPESGEPIRMGWNYLPGSRIELEILWTTTQEAFLGAWRPGSDSSWISVHTIPPEA